jgi:hypothetical protein
MDWLTDFCLALAKAVYVQWGTGKPFSRTVDFTPQSGVPTRAVVTVQFAQGITVTKSKTATISLPVAEPAFCTVSGDPGTNGREPAATA